MPGQESKDGTVRPVLGAAAGFAIGAALVGWAAYGIFHYFTGQPGTAAPSSLSRSNTQFSPPPSIEGPAAADLQQSRQQQDYLLSTYGWSDKKAGNVHIPMDRAMELELERAFAAQKDSPQK